MKFLVSSQCLVDSFSLVSTVFQLFLNRNIYIQYFVKISRIWKKKSWIHRILKISSLPPPNVKIVMLWKCVKKQKKQMCLLFWCPGRARPCVNQAQDTRIVDLFSSLAKVGSTLKISNMRWNIWQVEFFPVDLYGIYCIMIWYSSSVLNCEAPLYHGI